MGVAMRHNLVRSLVAGLALTLGVVPAAHAQYRADHIPAGPPVAVSNPTITPKPNAQLPLDDTEFTTSQGKKVKLGDLFNHGNKPVIVSMVYLSCPMLCGLNQDALINSVRQGPRSLRLGKDYDVVVVSIDPDDTQEAAETKRTNYLARLNLPPTQEGFTYLTGVEPNMKKLGDAIGFDYRRNDQPGDKFLHSLGIFVCTPYGRLSKTIVNTDYTPDELHAALLTAAEGKIGSGMLEQIALPCGAMRLNPLTGNYEHNPWFWAGTAGGAASVAFMAIFLTVMWRGELKRKRAADALALAGGDAPGH
jgi:protein SCO1/2